MQPDQLAPDGSVTLADYLTALRKGPTPKPSGLIFPEDMLAKFDELYAFTETKALESGHALTFDPASGTFVHGVTITGNRNSINPALMAGIDDPNCFGFVHAHPSASIGYKGGYCPHSVEDLLTFESYKDRPYFFMIVVSGPVVYTLVYIKGTSVWSDDVKMHLNQRLQEYQATGQELLYPAAGGQQAYGELGVGIEATEEAGEALRQMLIAKTPNFGKSVEKISYDECTAFSTRYHYFFAIQRRPQQSVCQLL
ncbi:hypothetical protein [Catellatospora methionotrophica]|uniref:hypothetical protein n=1 Tax=Catellatospora methionotrophica TaxID=121620 RepID=UPI0033DD70F6